MSDLFYPMDPKKEYYMFHKPVGCITAKRDNCHLTIMEYLTDLKSEDIHPLGRLDKDTSGLLLLSNDGAFTNYLMSPQNHIAKTYEFCVLGDLKAEQISKIEQGIYFTNDDKITSPCQLSIKSKTTVSEIFPLICNTKYQNLYLKHPLHPVTYGTITITEGRKHHVKKLLKYAYCYVVSLKRISIGHLSLEENLKPGEYRRLEEKDFRLLF